MQKQFDRTRCSVVGRANSQAQCHDACDVAMNGYALVSTGTRRRDAPKVTGIDHHQDQLGRRSLESRWCATPERPRARVATLHRSNRLLGSERFERRSNHLRIGCWFIRWPGRNRPANRSQRSGNEWPCIAPQRSCELRSKRYTGCRLRPRLHVQRCSRSAPRARSHVQGERSRILRGLSQRQLRSRHSSAVRAGPLPRRREQQSDRGK